MQRPKSGKRSRSPNDDTLNNNKSQSKVLVTQKISDNSNPEKMKQIHEKTHKLLFAAAAATPDDGAIIIAPPPEQFRLYGLTGNGGITIRNLANDVINPGLERRRSRCCQRLTLIHDRCGNCTDDLCEECGYSCRECSTFICRACVTVFGSNPEEADDPLCERCQMYFA
ncbi:apoptosis regulatory protein Siva-like [Drosophila subobscura]|uniref:apoptosis regulatory protein Siva-like n=1 Tax=Drosophila subobscura TaxID=7241 RepID=UPI00155B0673|nr:apoptosis regulatory protein Siva-like [Drosophila subobscura]